MQNRAMPSVMPSEKFSALILPSGQMVTIWSIGKITYEAMKPMVASIDTVNSRATVRSDRLAARSSMSCLRGSWGGSPGSAKGFSLFATSP